MHQSKMDVKGFSLSLNIGRWCSCLSVGSYLGDHLPLKTSWQLWGSVDRRGSLSLAWKTNSVRTTEAPKLFGSGSIMQTKQVDEKSMKRAFPQLHSVLTLGIKSIFCCLVLDYCPSPQKGDAVITGQAQMHQWGFTATLSLFYQAGSLV